MGPAGQIQYYGDTPLMSPLDKATHANMKLFLTNESNYLQDNANTPGQSLKPPPAARPRNSLDSVVLLAVEDAQNGEEEVEDVEVEADGGGDLLLDVVLAHDELGVDEDVGAEEEGGDAAIDELGGGAVGEEHGHEAEEDEGPEGAEEIGRPRGEVVLCLAREGREEDEDSRGEDDGVEDDGSLVEGDDDGDGVGLGEGEGGEEDEVGRVGLALPESEEKEAEGSKELGTWLGHWDSGGGVCLGALTDSQTT